MLARRADFLMLFLKSGIRGRNLSAREWIKDTCRAGIGDGKETVTFRSLGP